MFLLFLIAAELIIAPVKVFTFQYVSIISRTRSGQDSRNILFTFQYVSIISEILEMINILLSEFTFQYVSIISVRTALTT